MPFSTTYSRTKTYSIGSALNPDEMNSIQDDLGNQLATVNVAGGFNEGSNVRRGKSIIAGAESRSSTSYGTLTTPDRVQNIVLETSGLLFVAFQARWQNSVTSAGRAAIFLGSNQLKQATNSGASAVVQEATGPTDAAEYLPLSSTPYGLDSIGGSGTNYSTGDATTGQSISYAGSGGGIACIFAAAGTYTVAVQFKSTSGSVTVADRKLWVWTQSF
jgi:hypothetical protein